MAAQGECTWTDALAAQSQLYREYVGFEEALKQLEPSIEHLALLYAMELEYGDTFADFADRFMEDLLDANDLYNPMQREMYKDALRAATPGAEEGEGALFLASLSETSPIAGQTYEYGLETEDAVTEVSFFVGAQLVEKAECPEPPCHQLIEIPAKAAGSILRAVLSGPDGKRQVLAWPIREPAVGER